MVLGVLGPAVEGISSRVVDVGGIFEEEAVVRKREDDRVKPGATRLRIALTRDAMVSFTWPRRVPSERD